MLCYAVYWSSIVIYQTMAHETMACSHELQSTMPLMWTIGGSHRATGIIKFSSMVTKCPCRKIYLMGWVVEVAGWGDGYYCILYYILWCYMLLWCIILYYHGILYHVYYILYHDDMFSSALDYIVIWDVLYENKDDIFLHLLVVQLYLVYV